MSICQYLASEVHKPFIDNTTAAVAKEPEVSKAVKKKSPPSKKASKLAPGAGQKTAPVTAKPDLPPPTPVVSQLMEMGFNRRYIEYAIQTTGSSNAERLINWLIEHQDIDIPKGSMLAPAPAETPAVDATPTADSAAAAGDSRRVESETSSDSDESEEEEEDVEEAEGEGGELVVFRCRGLWFAMLVFLQTYHEYIRV